MHCSLPRSVALTMALVGAAQAFADSDCEAAPRSPLQLPAAEARMLRCSHELAASRAAVEAAVADVQVATQRPNPNLTLGVSNLNPQVGIGSGPLRDKTFDSSARIDQLIERGGKPALRERQSLALRAAAEADLAEQERLQRLAVREAFFDLAAAQERVRLLRESHEFSEQSAAAAGKRLAAGEIARAESSRFRLDAARAASDLRQAEADRARSAFDFARTIGAGAWGATIEVVPVWPQGAIEAANGERPDVAAARLRTASAEAGLELARSLATRDVTVGAQADHWPTSATNAQGTGISYSLGIVIPLHVRHANEGEAARALADLYSARAAFARVSSLAQSDRELVLGQVSVARERLARLEADALPAAHEVAEAAEFAYSRGAIGVMELLDARRSLKAVELDHLQARTDAAKAWARGNAAAEAFAP
jgi:cobalt-zinc-cadmium efflux system outer membrane protein